MPRWSVVVLLLLVSAAAAAQPRDEQRRVVLADGRVFAGTVADETADPVVIVTRDGVRREFPRASVVEIGPLIRGRFFRTDPVVTRHFAMPTARTLGGGRVRAGLLGIFPEVTAGLTDRVDLNAAGYFAVGVGAGVTPLVGLKAAVVEGPGVTVAVGASALASFAGDDTYTTYDPNGNPILVTEENGGVVGLPYGVVTVGDETRSVSFAAGVGVGQFGDEVTVGDGVLLAVGGDLQLNNGVKLIGEAIAAVGAGDSGVLVLPGVRFFGERFALDVVGFVVTDGEDVFGFAPAGGRFSYTF